MQYRSWVLFACFSVILLVSLIGGCLPSKVTDGIDKVEMITGSAQDGFGCKRVTLVTGDVAIVSELPGKQLGIAIARADPNNVRRGFQKIANLKGTYVIPTDISLGKLDLELFNVEYLAREGYDKMKSLPVLVTTSSMSVQAEQSIARGIETFGGRVKASFEGISTLALDLPVSKLGNSFSSLLEQPYVKKIWLDKKVHACLSESVPLIGAPALWNAGYNGTGIQIAILDTGIDATHPDLDDLDDNPNTYDPKVVREVNFSDDNTTDDLYGHGTHCAGIAAGTGAMSGGKYRGVAPAARLWNVKVLDKFGGGDESWVISGIEYASYGPDGIARSGDEADVISMSLGGDITDGYDPLSVVADMAVRLGVVVVVSVGNDREYFNIHSPGCARNVISVGATTKEDEIAYFSSRGPTADYRIKPDVLAPGVDIYSTVPNKLTGTYYQLKSGTSMAAPHVAGSVALLLQACKTLPSGLSLPNYVKDLLISTAKNLGYDVYTQGGGRIYLPSAVSADIVPDPATISFGNFPKEGAPENATVTFYNLNSTSSHVLNLNVSVSDLVGNLVNGAELNATVLDIAPNSTASVLLTINTSVPASFYSGRILASVDGKTFVHVIFGFTKANNVTVILKDRYGNNVRDRWVYVVGDPGLPDFVILGLQGPSDNVTFTCTSGNYHISCLDYNSTTTELFWTVADNVSITSDKIITFYEAETFRISFNPNKPNQLIVDAWIQMCIRTKKGGYWIATDEPLYKETADVYMSAASVTMLFRYSYYPKAYYNASDRFSLNTPEIYYLLYCLRKISQSVIFLPDYNNLVQRTAEYKVAEQPGVGHIAHFIGEPDAGWTGCGYFQARLPQRRVEWLSPSPALYCGIYDSGQATYWTWNTNPLSYPAKSKPYAVFGEHPLASGLFLTVGEGNFTIGTCLCATTSGEEYESPGDLTIFAGGTQVFYMTIHGGFTLIALFHGVLTFTVVARSFCTMPLSTNTTTELSFTTDPTYDCNPPRVKFRAKSSDMGCRVPPGEVNVNVTVSDESPLTSTLLEYSVDDGATWRGAIVRGAVGDTYQYSLRTMNDGAYVSLRFSATDSQGNRIIQTTIRGFLVKELGNFNGDRKVDGKDLAIVARSYNTNPGDLLWDSRADTNLDLKVDGFDVAVVASHYGKTW
jgi:subtilisin family serine protease